MRNWKMISKKLLAAALALMMCVGLLPVAAFAEGPGDQPECICTESCAAGLNENCPVCSAEGLDDPATVCKAAGAAPVTDTQENADSVPGPRKSPQTVTPKDGQIEPQADGNTVVGAPAPLANEGESTEAQKLQAAINEAPDGVETTITMSANIENMTTQGIITIPAEKIIVLDMSGHSITVAKDFSGRPIDNDGTLTVNGSGTIDSSASQSGFGAIRNDGTLTIMNGTYIGSVYGDGAAIRNGIGSKLTVHDGYFAATGAIYNVGEATIYKGEFVTLACSGCGTPYAYALNNRDENGVSGKMDILPEHDEDVKVHGPQGALASVGGATVYVKGGTFWTAPCTNDHKSNTFYAVYVSGKGTDTATCVIDGGEFSTTGNNACIYVHNPNEDDNGGTPGVGILTINGGSFDQGTATLLRVNKENGSNLSVHGGIFSSDAIEAYLAPDAATIPWDGDMFKVVPESEVDDLVVAKIVTKTTTTTTEDKYYSLQAAIAAANPGDTIEIVKSGDYAPITIPDGVSVKAGTGAEVVFKGSFDKTAAVGENVTFEGIKFEGANPLNYYIDDNLTVKNCHFVGDGTGTAMYIHTPNITVTGCVFENYTRGYYTCGDNHAIGTQSLTGNTFTNVKIPIDGYWGKPAGADSLITITGNTINPGSYGTSYIQVWDYAQYQAWLKGNGGVSSAVKANISGNTFAPGKLVVMATHCNWFTETSLTLGDAEKAALSYCSLVEVEPDNDVTINGVKLTPKGTFGSFETWNLNAKTDKTKGMYFYSIPNGEYEAEVTLADRSVHTLPLVVKEPSTESGTQKLIVEVKKATGATLTCGEVTVGATVQANLNTGEGTTEKVTWTSDNEKVAKVDDKGNVTGIAVGSATITAKVGNFTATCTVTVAKAHETTLTAFINHDLKTNTVKLNDEFMYAISVSNNTGKAWERLVIQNNIPAGLEIVSANPLVTIAKDGNQDTDLVSKLSFDQTKATEATTLTWWLPEDIKLPAGVTISLQYRARVTGQPGDKLTNSVTAGHYLPQGETAVSHSDGNDFTVVIARAYASSLLAFVPVPSGEGQSQAEVTVTVEGTSNPGTDPGTNPNPGGNTGTGGGTYYPPVIIPSNPSNPSNPSTPSNPSNPSNPDVEITDPDVPLAELPLPFTDVKDGDWFREAVAYVYSKELMNGDAPTLFAPGGICNRAMLATIIYRLEKEPDVVFASAFTDVVDGLWYSDAIEWGAANKVVEGYNGKFDPFDMVTREQIATMLFRYAKNKGYDVSAKGDLTAYPDNAKVSDWAKDGMTWAVGAELIKGDNGNLKPGAFATRAEIATILQRFCEKYVEESK